MLACILELSDPPYSRCLRIAKSRIHFESLVVDFKLRTGCVVIAPWQKRMPFCKAVPFRVFREKRCLLGRLGTHLQRANLVWAPKMTIHRQADYPIFNNPRRWDWEWPENNTLQRIFMLRTFPCLLLEFIAGILSEFVLMKMGHRARMGEPVTRILSESPRKVCNSISWERNLLQYWRPTTGHIYLLPRARDDTALVGTGRVIYYSHSRAVALSQDRTG